ncbi:hypothetical protein ACXIHB_13530 [Tenacibaculum sp. IMCC1]|uniref:Uncharacterized protein n=1 Tax=Tenacibaculum sp. Pbs-1 TaxID=3238748 RepID=A0AB33L546_9FLAO
MKLTLYVIFFFIIFNFPIPGVHSSIFLAIMVMLLLYFRKGGRNIDLYKLTKILRTSQFTLMFFLYLVLIVYTFLWAFLHGTNDYSIIKNLTLCFITILVGILFVPLAINHLFKEDDYLVEFSRLILVVFIVQSVIQILAFVEPSVAKFVTFFRKEKIQGFDYGGIRGLALTGNPYFRLSAGYGLSYIIFFYLYFKKKVNFPVIVFLLLFIGSFFSGRTAFVGLAVAIISYFVYSFVEVRLLFTRIFKFLGLIIIIVNGIILVYFFFVPENIRSIVDDKLLPFAFEFVYNYQSTGELSTSSSDTLNSMYFKVPETTFIYGDGRYMADNGVSYYKYTDAGYMRNLLFYGIFGLIYIIVSQILIFINPFLSTMNKNNKLYLLFILGFSFILHYKGEVLMFSPLYQLVVVIFSFSYLLKDFRCQS